jgi:hypothetical protein
MDTARLTFEAGKPYCFPRNLNMAQARRVIEKLFKDNPDRLHLGATALAKA